MSTRRLNIAVVGTGIAGLSASWLLSQRHAVHVYERERRIGGHAHTLSVPRREKRGSLGVDAGFIVYNETNYPNFVQLLRHLDVPTGPSSMSFSASLDGGRLEYSSDVPAGLFAQPANVFRPEFWSMLSDLRRFYRCAREDLRAGRLTRLTLGDYLARNGYGERFECDHLLPMGAAIWSSNVKGMRDFPAETFVRFFDSHGLLQLRDRPAWRTVAGGSRNYVSRLSESFDKNIRRGNPVRAVQRVGGRVTIEDMSGAVRIYDHVVLATHADEALQLLRDPSDHENELLGAMRYTRNPAVLHTDRSRMPRRRAAWASWNYVAGTGIPDGQPQLTYWMNRLQNLDTRRDIFVTLNPETQIPRDHVLARFEYDHPLYDRAALDAQPDLWTLQGQRNTWFCGSYFGYGFHEDALQSGLAVAERLGGVSRPWHLPDPSSRLQIRTAGAAEAPAKPLLEGVR